MLLYFLEEQTAVSHVRNVRKVQLLPYSVSTASVIQARENGQSIRQIAGELRVSTATVQQVLREGATQAA